jgi:Ran GTPase-activating protein (RanGAP) involved in mRNA processing and transport
VLRTLAAALADAPHLTELNLSDNALGEKGVRACDAVLKGQVGLREQAATWGGMGPAGWARIGLLVEGALLDGSRRAR